jgi:hypothetical protein
MKLLYENGNNKLHAASAERQSNMPEFLNFAAMELDEIIHNIFGRDIDTSGILDTDPSSSSPPPSK